MTFALISLADVVHMVRDAAEAAIVDTTADPDADPPVEGTPPSFVWTDVTATFRHPALVCDQGALVAWVEDLAPTGRPNRPGGCLTLTEYPIHARWWVCFPSMGADGVPPIAAREAVALRVEEVVPAVQRALVELCCGRAPDGVHSWHVDRGKSIRPGAGSTGWEWVVKATM